MIYRGVARWSRKANSNYVEYPIADLWGRSRKCTAPSPSLSLSLSYVPSSHVGLATLPITRFAIAFTYELNYYTQLPADCVATVSFARCPLNNERIIRDKLSNGENGLNHMKFPPSSFLPPSPSRRWVMDRSIFDVVCYWCLMSNRFEKLNQPALGERLLNGCNQPRAFPLGLL